MVVDNSGFPVHRLTEYVSENVGQTNMAARAGRGEERSTVLSRLKWRRRKRRKVRLSVQAAGDRPGAILDGQEGGQGLQRLPSSRKQKF